MSTYQFVTTPSTLTPSDMPGFELRKRERVASLSEDAHIRQKEVSARPFRASLGPDTHSEFGITMNRNLTESSTNALHMQINALYREIQQWNMMREECVAEAAGNKVSMFILHKVVKAEQLGIDIFTENLTAPDGWLAFAQLWRAGLIDCYGDLVMPTDAGVNIAKMFETA